MSDSWQRKVPAIVCAVTAAAIAAWVLLAASRGHFSGDHGVKFAQSVSLWDAGFSSRALIHDRALDPQGHFFPYGDLVRNYRGERQGIYSIVFTGVGAIAIGLFGLGGLVVLPLIGLGLTVAGLVILGRRLELSPWATSIAVVVAATATPLLFYAGQYQEHSLATGLVTLALGLLTPRGDDRRNPLAAGLLLGLAATVRPECYCALPAAGLVVLVQPTVPMRSIVRDGVWLVAGATAVLVVYWLINWRLSGVWDPLVVQNAHKVVPPDNARKILFGPAPGKPFVDPMIALHVAVYAALVPLHRLPASVQAIVRGVLGLVLLYVSVWAFKTQQDRTVVGLFATTPLAAAGLLRGPWRARDGAIWVFCVTFIVEVLHFDRSGTGGGLQYGARFLLPVVPALVLLAIGLADEAVRSRSKIAAVVAVLVTGWFVVETARASHVGYRKAEKVAIGGAEATDKARAAAGTVVVTRRWWESQVVSAVLLDKKTILNIHGDPTPALERLREQRVSTFAFVAKGDQRFSLRDGSQVVTVTRWPGWLEVQQAEIRAAP